MLRSLAQLASGRSAGALGASWRLSGVRGISSALPPPPSLHRLDPPGARGFKKAIGKLERTPKKTDGRDPYAGMKAAIIGEPDEEKLAEIEAETEDEYEERKRVLSREAMREHMRGDFLPPLPPPFPPPHPPRPQSRVRGALRFEAFDRNGGARFGGARGRAGPHRFDQMQNESIFSDFWRRAAHRRQKSKKMRNENLAFFLVFGGQFGDNYRKPPLPF